MLPLAAMAGAASAGKAIEKFGRRTIIVATAFPFIIGWGLIAASALVAKHEEGKLALLFIGRLLTG